MARPSKLTAAQCEKARTLRASGVSVPKLAKRFKVSESSMYKVMDGTYTARVEAAPVAPVAAPAPIAPTPTLPPRVASVPVPGATPSIFSRRAADAAPAIKGMHPTMAQLLDSASKDFGVEIDDLTLAAAELIVAKAHYARALAHQH